MYIENIRNIGYIKEDSSASLLLKVLDYDNQPFDLKSNDVVKVEILVGINEGRLFTKEPILHDEPGVLEFELDKNDNLILGANLVEIHIHMVDGAKYIAPSRGYFKLMVERNIDSLAEADVTKVTLDFFLDQVDERIAQIQGEIDLLHDTREYFETHLDETVDQTVDNKMTPFVEVVNSHLTEYETLLSKNAIMHNNIYRGKFLGNSVTSEQYQAISSGTFEDLYIGDYWTINGVNYRIAGFDYYYYTGDAVCTTHHAVIVPDTNLYTHVMNDTNTTKGGYVNSKMYTEGLAQALSTIKSAFSGHVLKHRQLLSNATLYGKASGWAWFDSEVELMNEVMVYGSVVWGESAIGGSGYNIGVNKSQLPLFALNPRMINTRQSYWLRDVVSDSFFANMNTSGLPYYSNASNPIGVRPVFCIS